jgi:hypothetical protein
VATPAVAWVLVWLAANVVVLSVLTAAMAGYAVFRIFTDSWGIDEGYPKASRGKSAVTDG